MFLFGESLGGYLSVALALRRGEVWGVSEMSGGIPVAYAIDDPNRVDVLILHGKDDALVAVQSAEELKQYCLNHHLDVEMSLYPGAGHYLPDAVKGKFIAQTITFFQHVLADGHHFHHE